MIKKNMFLVMVLSLLTSSVAYSDHELRGKIYDFRRANWGMTKLEVMSGEELKPVSFTGPSLIYKTRILDREMHLIYEFVENRLVGTLYAFITFDDNDYLDMKKLLVRKYKNPLLSRDNGPLDYEFKWETKSTEIVLKPGKGRDCRVEYAGKDIKKFIKEQDVLSDKLITDEVIEQF